VTAELARQLAEVEAEEERERVVEAARIAEEARKQVEVERLLAEVQRKWAEEIAVQQGAAGGSGSEPMAVGETAEERKKKKVKEDRPRGTKRRRRGGSWLGGQATAASA
jgi:Flp pilus assembly secretin CpaC